jgi:hypothetical protein
VDRIHLAKDSDRWRAVVNRVMKLSDSIKSTEILQKVREYQLLKNNAVPCSSLLSNTSYQFAVLLS